MGGESVRVVAKLKARPEKAAQLTAVLLELIRETRKEKGCIQYELLRSADDPAEFVFVEEWASGAVLDAHLKSAHLQGAFVKMTPLLAGDPGIRRYALVA